MEITEFTVGPIVASLLLRFFARNINAGGSNFPFSFRKDENCNGKPQFVFTVRRELADVVVDALDAVSYTRRDRRVQDWEALLPETPNAISTTPIGREELEKILDGYEQVNFMPTREQALETLAALPLASVDYRPPDSLMSITTTRPLTASEAFRLARFVDAPDAIADDQTRFTIGWD